MSVKLDYSCYSLHYKQLQSVISSPINKTDSSNSFILKAFLCQEQFLFLPVSLQKSPHPTLTD